MNYKDLSIIVCSYNTPLHLITLLKSFVAIHGDGPHNIIIMENSTNEETRKQLDENNIPYIKNPGGTHSKSIDETLQSCKTKYALLVDSDIVFIKKIDKLLDVMKSNNATLLGELCGDRGGYRLHNRIQPWFCLINVENIKRNKIWFHDQERIDKTGSNYFYQSVPLNPHVNNIVHFYDVGATFYEDINTAKMNILNAKGIIKYFKHFEGSSWQRASGHEGYVAHGNHIYAQFYVEAEKYKSISIKDKFVDGRDTEIENTKILLIQPVFCPTKEFLEINKKSIESILKYCNTNVFRNLKIVFGGYCKTDEYWKELETVINNNKLSYSKITIRKATKNYGKACLVNTLFKENYTDENFLFTMDSDIIFDIKEFNMLRRLIAVSYTTEKESQKKLGMLSLNQKGDCCHWFDKMDMKTVVNGETIQRPSSNVGIAGGCLFIPIESFKKVNGYRVMGIYSGDDGFLLHDLLKEGLLAFIISSVSIIHNSNEKMYGGKYQQWKESNLKKCLEQSGKILSSEELETEAAEAENKWNASFK